MEPPPQAAFFAVFRTLVVGGGLGLLGAALLVVPLARHWVPDSLQNPIVLAGIFVLFTAANLLQKESGLLAVTVMGIGLANQRQVAVKHLVAFKENLTVLLVSSLFIILAARLQPADFRFLDLNIILFLSALVLLGRPATVLLSTIRSKLTWREKLFLCCMAPRGIVAAAVSSVFALEMVDAGHAGADRLPTVTFAVIVGTVTLYGLGATPLARWLGLARPNPQGVVFVGAHSWAREAAAALVAQGYPVLMADSDWANISAARLAGLPTYYGSILGEHALESIEFGEFGRLIAMTPNDEVNSLACLRFVEIFGRAEVYQLAFGDSGGRREAVSLEQRGRLLFGNGVTHARLADRFERGSTVKATHLTKEFDYAAFRALHSDATVPLFIIQEKGEVVFFTAESTITPLPGEVLVSLTDP